MAKKKTTRKKITRKKRVTRKRAPRATARKKKTTRRKVARKKTARKKTAGRGRPRGGSKLSGASTEQLMAELDRRRSTLQDERDQIVARLEEIDSELGGFGGGSASAPKKRGPGRPRAAGRPTGRKAGRRGRPPSGNSLADALHKLLHGVTMGVSEAADAVKKAGYKTKSDNFRTIVNQALISNPKRFRKVARGQYTSK